MFSTSALASIVNIYANNFAVEPCSDKRRNLLLRFVFLIANHDVRTTSHEVINTQTILGRRNKNHNSATDTVKQKKLTVEQEWGQECADKRLVRQAGITQLRKVLGLYHFFIWTIRHSLESKPETPMKKSRLKIFNFVRSKYLTNKRENYRQVIKESECNSNWLQRFECVSNVGMCLTDFFVYITSLYV